MSDTAASCSLAPHQNLAGWQDSIESLGSDAMLVAIGFAMSGNPEAYCSAEDI